MFVFLIIDIDLLDKSVRYERVMLKLSMLHARILLINAVFFSWCHI